MRTIVIFCLGAAVGLAVAAARFLPRRRRDPSPPAAGLRTNGNLLQIARVGLLSVAPSTVVQDAIRSMAAERVGAILVTDSNETLKGIFTERDLMLRVVLRRRDPERTPVSAVMTSPVTIVQNNLTFDEALKEMAEKHIRHLPVVGASGNVEGMLSMRHLLGQKVENLEETLDSLAAYISADGIGG